MSCGFVLFHHDVGFVMRQCQRIVVLDLGSVLAVGNPPEIRANGQVRSAYLGDI
jgi:branched-chain amino acid transport system ATP-binding protein